MRTERTLDFLSSLTQHCLAFAARLLVQHSAYRRSGYSLALFQLKSNPCFRCVWIEQTERRTSSALYSLAGLSCHRSVCGPLLARQISGFGLRD